MIQIFFQTINKLHSESAKQLSDNITESVTQAASYEEIDVSVDCFINLVESRAEAFYMDFKRSQNIKYAKSNLIYSEEDSIVRHIIE